MIEDNIRLVLNEYSSSFITYEIKPGIYTFKELSEAFLRNAPLCFNGFKNSINIEFNDIGMKNKLIVRPGITATRFDKKSFSTILASTPHWDYKHYIEYISQEFKNSSTINKTHLKCDVINGSIVDGLRQPILFGFVLDTPSGYKMFCEPETIHYKKTFENCNIVFGRW